MRRVFNRIQLTRVTRTRGSGFWLRAGAIGLAALNVAALFLYLLPPGGSRAELTEENSQVQTQIRVAKASSLRLRSVAAKVQRGSTESADFESKFFLPRRVAYKAVLTELQQIATDSNMVARDSVFTEEPIEGTADLTLLNVTANFDGAYTDLVRLLNQVDRSPMLLILDTLQAAPQQAAARLNCALRFQEIIQEDGSVDAGPALTRPPAAAAGPAPGEVRQ